MALGFGHNAVVSIGIQTTHGTVVARTEFSDIISESIAFNPVRVISPKMGSSVPRVNKELGVESGGTLELVGDYESTLIDSLFKQVFGSVSTHAPTGAGQHTYSVTSEPAASGFSLEIDRDTASFLYVNCKVNQVTMTQEPDDYARFSFAIMGGLEIILPSATSADFTADAEMTNGDLSVEFDDTARVANSLSIVLNRNLTQRPRIGTSARKEVQPSGMFEVTGSVELDFDNLIRYEDFKNLTNLKFEAIWTGSTLTGTYTRLHHVTMGQVNLEPPGTPVVSGRGPLVNTYNFRAFETTRGALNHVTLVRTNANNAVA